MRKNAVLLAFTLAAALGLGACGPDSKQACSGPGQCPAGQFCAAEGICWADTYPPAIDSVTVACAAPCARDGVITVTAVARDESRLAEVRASLDLDPAKTVVLAKTATGYGGQLQLAQWPFPAFERKVSVTVVAKDEAGNTKAQVATDAATVARVKWVYEAGANVASVAVADDGAVYLGVLRSPSQLVKVMNGTKAWDATVGTLGVSAVAIGTSAIWTGNQDGKVFAVSSDGVVLNGAGCNAGSAVVGMAVSGDTALAATSNGGVYASDSKGACISSALTKRSDTAAVLSRTGDVFLASQNILRSLTLQASGFLENWFVSPPAPVIGQGVQVPVAVDATDGIWTLSTDGKLNRTTAAGATATVKTTSWSDAGPVLLSDG
ncbi:MAG TPA: hypothetical protein VFP50_00705, partial [Anaeromyxobacteraceae bacterium]|nr:hypothetical protein [Anaeromyxobacteraceae bacterium]